MKFDVVKEHLLCDTSLSGDAQNGFLVSVVVCHLGHSGVFPLLVHCCVSPLSPPGDEVGSSVNAAASRCVYSCWCKKTTHNRKMLLNMWHQHVSCHVTV